jgi:hypothetical protein
MIDNILNNIKIDETNIQNIDYIDYNRNLINKIYNFTKKLDNSINISHIFKDVYFYCDKNIQHRDYYKIIILKFIKYFNNKYEDNTEKKIAELISRINIYSLGVVFIQYMSLYIEQNEKYDKIFIRNLFEIYKLCALQFNIVKNNNVDNIVDNIDSKIDYNVDIIDIDIENIINKFNEIEC